MLDKSPVTRHQKRCRVTGLLSVIFRNLIRSKQGKEPEKILWYLETRKPEFYIEYTVQYSWAEDACAMLLSKNKS